MIFFFYIIFYEDHAIIYFLHLCQKGSRLNCEVGNKVPIYIFL